MARFDRYMLSQLMVLFGFFALVLVSVYWVNRAVILFDRLIADGHSAGVFVEFTALSLPSVIALILPMAAFAAAVYVTNRLIGDSEMTVMQATGFSPWRLARPVLVFGVLVAVLASALSHFLVPASLAQLRLRETEISGSVSARLLREGTFLHPADGVTFYIRDISADGTLSDVFLSDRRRADRDTIYTASEAYVVRSDSGPRLVMVSGLAQTLRHRPERLSTTTFADFSYDISALVERDAPVRPRIKNVITPELIRDPQDVAERSGDGLGNVIEELNSRFEEPLLSIVAALIGFATLMAGRFSRFGAGRQIVAAIFLLVLVKLVESAVTEPVRSNPQLWPLVYAPAASGFAIVWGLLHRASAPRRRPRGAETPA